MSGIASFLSSSGGTHAMNFSHDAYSTPDNARHHFWWRISIVPLFAAFRKRDEKSHRRDHQPGNLPFISRVTGSGNGRNIGAGKLAHRMQPCLRGDPIDESFCDEI